MTSQFFRVWQSAGMIVFIVVLGGSFGLLAPHMATHLRPLADLYLCLIQMVVLPIMTCAIISSLGSALLDGGGGRLLLKTVIIFVVFLFTAAVSALIIGLFFQPGAGLSPEAQQALGVAMEQGEKKVSESQGLWGFFVSLFPVNIVAAADQGQMLGVMTFSILIGIALGTLDNEVGRPVIIAIDTILQACLKVMGWVLLFLPIGIFALLSVNMAKLGADTISLALKLIVTFYVSIAVAFIVLILFCSIKCKKSPAIVFRVTWDAVLLGFVTQADYPPMALAIKAAQDLGVEEGTSKLVVPLGTNMLNLGYVLYVVIACLFVVQLYGKPASLDVIGIIIIGGILVAVAGADLAMLTIVLGPMGLPFEAAVAVLAPLGPLLNPVLVPINVLGNIAAAIMATDFSRRQTSDF